MKRQSGFTLLELLTVIAIMALLSTLAVTSYFGAIRGMTRRSAVKHLVNTLTLAKQQAALQGTHISVLIYNELNGRDDSGNDKYIPSYVIVQQIGRVTQANGGKIYDEFTALDAYFGFEDQENKLRSDGKYNSFRLYNLTEGVFTQVYPKVLRGTYNLPLVTIPNGNDENQNDKTFITKPVRSYAFVVNTTVNSSVNGDPGNWDVGDRYGIEISPPNSLPRNFTFTKINEQNTGRICVTFFPDGSCDRSETISIAEQIGASEGSWKKTVVRVDSTGEIEYDEKWN